MACRAISNGVQAVEEKLGTIRIAPAVLGTIASLTALAVPGVIGMTTDSSNGVGRFLGRQSSARGVRIQIKDDAVFVDLYLVVSTGANMLQTAQDVQREVTSAIDTMVGMPVQEVNVYIQDVT